MNNKKVELRFSKEKTLWHLTLIGGRVILQLHSRSAEKKGNPLTAWKIS